MIKQIVRRGRREGARIVVGGFSARKSAGFPKSRYRDDSICRVSQAVCISICVPRHRRFTTQGRAIAADHPPRPTS